MKKSKKTKSNKWKGSGRNKEKKVACKSEKVGRGNKMNRIAIISEEIWPFVKEKARLK